MTLDSGPWSAAGRHPRAQLDCGRNTVTAVTLAHAHPTAVRLSEDGLLHGQRRPRAGREFRLRMNQELTP